MRAPLKSKNAIKIPMHLTKNKNIIYKLRKKINYITLKYSVLLKLHYLSTEHYFNAQIYRNHIPIALLI